MRQSWVLYYVAGIKTAHQVLHFMYNKSWLPILIYVASYMASPTMYFISSQVISYANSLVRRLIAARLTYVDEPSLFLVYNIFTLYHAILQYGVPDMCQVLYGEYIANTFPLIFPHKILQAAILRHIVICLYSFHAIVLKYNLVTLFSPHTFLYGCNLL